LIAHLGVSVRAFANIGIGRARLLGEPRQYSPHLRRMPTIATRSRLAVTGIERHRNPVQVRYPGRLQRFDGGGENCHRRGLDGLRERRGERPAGSG
jgi:hypothetical protein